jgi:hypothetical protein
VVATRKCGCIPLAKHLCRTHNPPTPTLWVPQQCRPLCHAHASHRSSHFVTRVATFVCRPVRGGGVDCQVPVCTTPLSALTTHTIWAQCTPTAALRVTRDTTTCVRAAWHQHRTACWRSHCAPAAAHSPAPAAAATAPCIGNSSHTTARPPHCPAGAH